MRLEIDIPEHHYNNIMALDSLNLGRVPYKGIIMYAINAIKHGKALEQEPILDKIRAEIQNGTHHFLDGEPIIEIKEVLQIIDKHISGK